MINVHRLTLPSYLQAESFEQFARTRYLPGLMTQPSRSGVLVDARLLRQMRVHEGDSRDLGNMFLLIVEWEGVPIDLPRVEDPAVQGLFDAFRVAVERIGYFDVIGTRLEEK